VSQSFSTAKLCRDRSAHAHLVSVSSRKIHSHRYSAKYRLSMGVIIPFIERVFCHYWVSVSRARESLGRTIGEILHKAWYRLGLTAAPKEIELALALDETTVDIPWELSILQKGSPVHMCEKISLGRLRRAPCHLASNSSPGLSRITLSLDFASTLCLNSSGFVFHL
jgi:hypothetical protein